MRNTQERISEMHERAREIRRKRDRLRTAAAGTVSGLLTVCLVFVLHRMEHLNHAILNEDSTGSSLLSDSAGGYVLIAVLAFAVGVIITAVIYKNRK